MLLGLIAGRNDLLKRSILSKVLLWSLVLLVMAVIYGLSAQTSTESNALSGKTIRVIADLLLPGFDDLSVEQQAQLVREWQNTVRKTAHLTIYMMLGTVTMLALLQHEIGRRSRVVGALGISVAYAISDEVHQFFVSGRGPQVSDVFVDGMGALIGVCLVLIILKLVSKRAQVGVASRSTE